MEWEQSVHAETGEKVPAVGQGERRRTAQARMPGETERGPWGLEVLGW